MDTDIVANVLKTRDISQFKERKKVIKEKEKADRIYFTLYGLFKLKENAESKYYGIIPCGWAIGEESILKGRETMIDSVESGKDAGMVYLTLPEIAEIEDLMKDKGLESGYERFMKRLQKYSFIKALMRKVNIEKDEKFKHLQ